MIHARNVCKRFGSFLALDRLSFRVAPGEVVGFLGLNGAGKTTTLRIIASFQPPTSGSVQVAGFDTVRQSDRTRRLIGYLPEQVPLYQDMRVNEFLRFRGRLKGIGARDIKGAVARVVERCGLKQRECSIIGTLSKGFRQRVGLADALVHRPKLLILDEPTSGLDPDQRIEIRELLSHLGQECTVLLSTHILPEAEAICDKIIIIHGGMIRASDSLANLRAGLMGYTVRYEGPPLPGHASTSQETPGATALHVPSLREAQAAVREAILGERALLEMRSQRPSLETIFMKITTGRLFP